MAAEVTVPVPSSQAGSAVTPPTTKGKFIPTEGWYITLACGIGIATANTKVGVPIFGILLVALIFQTSLMLQGK
jgi:hypothetical protein